MADFVKDPDAVLDYSVDWSSWLASGETIASSSWVVTGATADSDTNDNTSATVWISAGTAGTTVTATNSITTDSSPARQDDRTITILVRER